MTVKEALMHPWLKKFELGKNPNKPNKENEFETFSSTTEKKK